jgi:hypothetical protein
MAPCCCLHQWGAHEHPSLASPDDARPGNGLLLFFRVDDFADAVRRARALVTRLAEEPQMNPNTGTMEFALRDPDGYYVMINALTQPDSTHTRHDRAFGRTLRGSVRQCSLASSARKRGLLRRVLRSLSLSIHVRSPQPSSTARSSSWSARSFSSSTAKVQAAL